MMPAFVFAGGCLCAAVAVHAAGAPAQQVEWVSIEGGQFMMGIAENEDLFQRAKPVHKVSMGSFQMSKTLVTIEQYAECVAKGVCTPPDTGVFCNWEKPGRQNHPVNCVDWNQANLYARFKGARLPSESEYEYAAKSGGRNQRYPWGDEAATCDRAVMRTPAGESGCGADGTMPVCSKPAGNTAQGLCDMAGNVWEWVQDKYQDSYNGTPADGRAFEGKGWGSFRVMRGGGFDNKIAALLRADFRFYDKPGFRFGTLGFRLAR